MFLMLLFDKVHIKNRTQVPTHQQKLSFACCLNFVIFFRTFRWIFTRLIFFYTNFSCGVGFFLLKCYLKVRYVILKLDFGYNIFVFKVIMFLFSNFFRYGSDVFLHQILS